MLRNNADVRQYFELGLPVLAWNRIGRRSGIVYTFGKLQATPLFGSRCVRETENLSYSSHFLIIQ